MVPAYNKRWSTRRFEISNGSAWIGTAKCCCSPPDWRDWALPSSSSCKAGRRTLAYVPEADVRADQSAPQLGDREQRYPGTCRGRYSSVADAERESGKDAGLRFRVPEGPVAVTDELAGRMDFDVSAEVGDFHIARRDHRPAYQLAVVVDDAHQGVTEVLRGDDLLPSAARQILLQRALGFETPSWVHVPLVLDEDGRRLAKREDDLSLAELRSGGTDPRAVVGWAAGTAGLDAPDRARAAELVHAFDLKRLRREPERLSRATVQRLREARAQ